MSVRVPYNLTMFLFHTILTLNTDINSSFCIFLIDYPLFRSSVSSEFKSLFYLWWIKNIGPNFLLNHSDKLQSVFARSSTLTYKSHVILISITVGTPRSRASADDFRALCPAVRCNRIQCGI